MGSPTGALESKEAESSFTFIPRGAIIQEFRVAGHNIVQNFPEASLYDSVPHPHFGETIGRTTNRIKAGRIPNLNGKTYQLAQNNGGNNLHGGPTGWGRRNWKGPKAVNRNGKEGVEFKYLSRDGEEGYPGTVEARVWYVASIENGKTVLEVEYEAELVGGECEETVVGMTNHRYLEPYLIPALNFLPLTALWTKLWPVTLISIFLLLRSLTPSSPLARTSTKKSPLMAFLQVESSPFPQSRPPPTLLSL